MNEPSVLVDGMQLLQKRGTGIASYTRTLTKALRSLGAKVNLLFGTDSYPRRGDPANVLATQVFCHRPADHRLAHLVMTAVHTRFGLKRSTKATEVLLKDVDLTFLDPPLPQFERLFNARAAFDHAHAASLWGTSMATVIPPEEFAAVHWTGPVPLKSNRGPNLYTIHDLVPIQYPYFVIDRPGHSARLHAAIAQEADGIVTVSETSKSKIIDILRIPPDRVTVTYQPVPIPSPMSQDDAEWIVSSFYKASPQSYALYLGAIEPKKNVKRLIEAFLLARLDIPLLLVGPKGWLFEAEEELLALIANSSATELPSEIHGVISRKSERFTESTASANLGTDLPIRYLGYLPRRHVTALLQCARFLVFPSIYEGFGLPALEAMYQGVPVLTSRTASLREVAGDAAHFVDPIDIDDIAQGIRVLDSDNDLRSELALKGPVQAARFSEEAYTQRLARAYAKIGVLFPRSPAPSAGSPSA